jgi:hypothetical protein
MQTPKNEYLPEFTLFQSLKWYDQVKECMPVHDPPLSQMQTVSRSKGMLAGLTQALGLRRRPDPHSGLTGSLGTQAHSTGSSLGGYQPPVSRFITSQTLGTVLERGDQEREEVFDPVAAGGAPGRQIQKGAAGRGLPPAQQKLLGSGQEARKDASLQANDVGLSSIKGTARGATGMASSANSSQSDLENGLPGGLPAGSDGMGISGGAPYCLPGSSPVPVLPGHQRTKPAVVYSETADELPYPLPGKSTQPHASRKARDRGAAMHPSYPRPGRSPERQVTQQMPTPGLESPMYLRQASVDQVRADELPYPLPGRSAEPHAVNRQGLGGSRSSRQGSGPGLDASVHEQQPHNRGGLLGMPHAAPRGGTRQSSVSSHASRHPSVAMPEAQTYVPRKAGAAPAPVTNIGKAPALQVQVQGTSVNHGNGKASDKEVEDPGYRLPGRDPTPFAVLRAPSRPRSINNGEAGAAPDHDAPPPYILPGSSPTPHRLGTPEPAAYNPYPLPTATRAPPQVAPPQVASLSEATAGDQSAELRLLVQSFQKQASSVPPPQRGGPPVATAAPMRARTPPAAGGHLRAADVPAAQGGSKANRGVPSYMDESSELRSLVQGSLEGGAAAEGLRSGAQREAPKSGEAEMSQSDELRMLMESLKTRGARA